MARWSSRAGYEPRSLVRNGLLFFACTSQQSTWANRRSLLWETHAWNCLWAGPLRRIGRDVYPDKVLTAAGDPPRRTPRLLQRSQRLVHVELPDTREYRDLRAIALSVPRTPPRSAAIDCPFWPYRMGKKVRGAASIRLRDVHDLTLSSPVLSLCR